MSSFFTPGISAVALTTLLSMTTSVRGSAIIPKGVDAIRPPSLVVFPNSCTCGIPSGPWYIV